MISPPFSMFIAINLNLEFSMQSVTSLLKVTEKCIENLLEVVVFCVEATSVVIKHTAENFR